MNAFIKSQFSTFPFAWMFHSKTFKTKVNRIHGKVVKLVCRKKSSLSSDNLVKKDETVNIHQRDLQILATKFYKVKYDIAPDTMKYIFHFAERPYNLRNNSTLKRIPISYSKNLGIRS